MPASTAGPEIDGQEEEPGIGSIGEANRCYTGAQQQFNAEEWSSTKDDAGLAPHKALPWVETLSPRQS